MQQVPEIGMWKAALIRELLPISNLKKQDKFQLQTRAITPDE